VKALASQFGVSDNIDLGAAVWSAVSQLEPRSREVFLLVRFQQHSLEMAATALGLSPAEVGRLFAQATQEVDTRIGLSRRQLTPATEQPGEPGDRIGYPAAPRA
jgi:DNA-directed RNA polymerase specialized sigma24 family protein